MALLWNHGIFWKFPTFLKSWVKEGSSGAKNAIDVVERAVIKSCFFQRKEKRPTILQLQKDMRIKLQREWMLESEMRWGIGRNLQSIWKAHVLLLKNMRPCARFIKFTHMIWTHAELQCWNWHWMPSIPFQPKCSWIQTAARISHMKL